MYKVEGLKITLTRGDSFMANVEIKNADGTDYYLQEGDKISFYLKRNILDAAKARYVDAKPLITRRIPNETQTLTLQPVDTKGLNFGEYVYDIELEYANGDVDTFINNAPFELVAEVG